MKKIAEMQTEEYGTTAEGIMVVGAMKFYLQSMEPAEALKKVAAVYEPKVIRLDSGEGVPVQSIIEGAKYAAFIDEAVMFAAQEMEDGRITEKLESIDGKHVIKSASVEFHRRYIYVPPVGEKIVALRRGINLLFGRLDGKIKVHWDRVSSYSVV